MLRKPKALRIDLGEDTLKTAVTVLIGSEEEIINSFSQWVAPEDMGAMKERITDGNTEAELCVMEANCTLCCILYIKKDHFNYGTLIHELLHYVFHTLSEKGMNVTRDSEEVYCYLLGCLLNKFETKYNKLKKKEDSNG